MKPLISIRAVLALAPACKQAESGPTAPIAEIRSAPARAPESRGPKRARDLGVPFDGTPGDWSAITDDTGVQVGHTMLIEGNGPSAIRTGVTATLPGVVVRPVFASIFRINGDGAMTGTHYIEEKGELISLIVLTRTASEGEFTVGVLVQANYGQRDELRNAGVPVGREITNRMPELWEAQAGDLFFAFSTARPKRQRGSAERRASFLRDNRASPRSSPPQSGRRKRPSSRRSSRWRR